MFDFLRFCSAHGVPHVESGNEHCRPNWSQVDCPFCNDPKGSYHMGFNFESGQFVCWKCKWHPVDKVLMALLRKPYGEVVKILAEFGHGTRQKRVSRSKPAVDIGRRLEWPFSALSPSKEHIQYLTSRGFDAERLIAKHRLTGTGRGQGVWSRRLVIPIINDGFRIVSFQTRDVTDKARLRYISCPAKLELENHRSLLYGSTFASGRSVVVVEGVFDAWRLGDGAVATFGIGWTKSQLSLLRRWDRVVIMYDTHKEDGSDDEDALLATDRLASSLSALGKTVLVHTLDGKDPADLTQRRADKLMEALKIR